MLSHRPRAVPDTRNTPQVLGVAGLDARVRQYRMPAPACDLVSPLRPRAVPGHKSHQSTLARQQPIKVCRPGPSPSDKRERKKKRNVLRSVDGGCLVRPFGPGLPRKSIPHRKPATAWSRKTSPVSPAWPVAIDRPRRCNPMCEPNHPVPGVESAGVLPSGWPSRPTFHRMTVHFNVAMARVPFPTATARMDHDGDPPPGKIPWPVPEGSRSMRCSRKIGGSPRFVAVSWGRAAAGSGGACYQGCFAGSRRPSEGEMCVVTPRRRLS